MIIYLHNRHKKHILVTYERKWINLECHFLLFTLLINLQCLLKTDLEIDGFRLLYLMTLGLNDI